MIIISFLLIFLFYSYVPAATNQNNFEIPSDLQQNISTNNLRNIVGNLSSFSRRETGTQDCIDASLYIYNWIESNTNASALFENWTWMGNPSRNVIGETTGNSPLIIISAHFDSISESDLAPGANDDASGIAVGLESLRLLSQYKQVHSDLDVKILFIAFSGEEQALAGSRNWIQNNVNTNPIYGVINLDTLGYGTGQSLIYNSESEWFATIFLESIQTITLNYYLIKKTIIYPDSSVGDHQSFWNRGIPAIWMFEDGPSYPFFHSENDIIERVNFNLLVDAVKIVNAGVYVSNYRLSNLNRTINIVFLIILSISIVSISLIIIKKSIKDKN
ncbi:MAG: M28 family metallopeptidase [Candidatus Helarchaeota archaeon]